MKITVSLYCEETRRMRSVEIREGDVVTWKRQGRTGAYRAKVLRIEPSQRLPIILALQTHDGKPVPYEKVRCRFGILNVVESAGVPA
jgi:hypothetical protein